MTNPITKDNTFKRKTYAKGFSNHKGLDDFIQNSLDKYYFVDPMEEMYEATGVYSKFIVSNKSAIPDLVIWNKKFNKNECFFEGSTKDYNAFPRFKFILKAKPPNNFNSQSKETSKKSGKNLSSVSNTKGDIKDFEDEIEARNERYDRNDEEDIQWEDVDVKEFESAKLKFQALPKDLLVFKKEKIEDDEPEFEENNFSEELNNIEIQNNTYKVEEIEKIEVHEHNFKTDKLPLENLFEYNLQENKNDFNTDFITIFEKIINKNNDNPIAGSSVDNIFKNKENLNTNYTGNFNNNNFAEIILGGKIEMKTSFLNKVTNINLGEPIEKNSLFEKDYTSMFLNDNNYDDIDNTDSEDGREFKYNQENNFQNIQPQIKIYYGNNNNDRPDTRNLIFEQQNNFDDRDNFNPNTGNFNSSKNNFNHNNFNNNINNFNNNYSNLNPQSEIQLNLNSDYEMKRNMRKNNHEEINLNQNNKSNHLFNPISMSMPIPMPMPMNNFPNNMNNMNNMGCMNNIKSPQQQQLLMQPFGMPFPNSNPQFEHMIGNFPNNNNFQPNNQEYEEMSNLLENPVNIVQKNITKRGWFLMAEKDKILGNFNSIDLLSFLEDKIKAGSKFENMWITDYDTDIYFTPTNLYEVLRENLPKIFDKIKNGKNRNNINMNMNMNMMPNMMPKIPMRIGNMPYQEPPMMQMMGPPFDPRMCFNKNPNIERGNTHMNMNINLQVVKNNINLNNIMLPNQSSHPGNNGNNFGMKMMPDFNNFQPNNGKNINPTRNRNMPNEKQEHSKMNNNPNNSNNFNNMNNQNLKKNQNNQMYANNQDNNIMGNKVNPKKKR